VKVSAFPDSSTSYTLNTELGTSAYTNYTHYTIIIYNDAQISNTKIYRAGTNSLNYTGNTKY
jgi:hypothetical protein